MLNSPWHWWFRWARGSAFRFDCFKDVVVLQEAGSENTVLGPGVGQILTEPLSGAPQEIEQLINVKELSPSALAELSAEALQLDEHAVQTVPSVLAASNPRGARAR